MADKKSESPKKDRAKNHPPEEEPNYNTVLGADDEEHIDTVAGVSRATAMLLALMSALVGGAIGWIGPALFDNSGEETAALRNSLDLTKAELSQATKDRQALSDRIDQLQTDHRATGSASKSVSQSLAALQTELEELKARPAPVDNSEALTELNEKVSTLSAFSTEEGAEVNILDLVKRLETIEAEGPSESEMGTRLEALETEVKDLGERAPEALFPEPDTTPIEIPVVETKADQENALAVLVESFPREKLLEAVKAQEVLANRKPSWLQRTLSKHVKVRDEGQAAPATVIDEAEAALAKGEVTETIRLINTLNPPVKLVAADWISAAKKAAILIEKDL